MVSVERLKPDRWPTLNPVPEYLADADRLAVYADTKHVLQVPWMGVVTMAFAHYPTFYQTLWGGVRDLAASKAFVDASQHLRRRAEAHARDLKPTELRGRLTNIGYADREQGDIDTCLEMFSHGNQPYLLIATIARLLLEGHALSSDAELPRPAGRHGPSDGQTLVLIEPHHADAGTRAVYDSIKSTLGLPFVNTDYRALARWPSYFALAWDDLAEKIAQPDYITAVTDVHRTAIELALSLPNPGGLKTEDLRKSAEADAPIDEVLSVVQLFQWLLPGLVLNVAYFRAQMKPRSLP